MSYRLKRLTYLGMLVAMQVVLSRFLSVTIPPTPEYLVKISFSFLPTAIAAMLFGPLWGGVCGALGDIIGTLLFQPGAAFFPGFTLTAFLTGLIYGVFLYEKPVKVANSLAASASVSLICSLGLNTLWLYILFKNAVLGMIPGRALNAAAMIIVQPLCFIFCAKIMKRQLEELLNERKGALRREARSFYLGDGERRAELSRAVCERVLELPEYRDAATVFCYFGTERELETKTIVEDALAAGKLLCVPFCEDNHLMTARVIHSLDELKEGSWKLLEPSADAAVVNKEDIDLAIVPTLMCSRKFERLGSGGGYYDRYLESSNVKKAALCCEALLKNELPANEHDIKMDIIVTEKATLRREEKTKVAQL